MLFFFSSALPLNEWLWKCAPAEWSWPSMVWHNSTWPQNIPFQISTIFLRQIAFGATSFQSPQINSQLENESLWIAECLECDQIRSKFIRSVEHIWQNHRDNKLRNEILLFSVKRHTHTFLSRKIQIHNFRGHRCYARMLWNELHFAHGETNVSDMMWVWVDERFSCLKRIIQ